MISHFVSLALLAATSAFGVEDPVPAGAVATLESRLRREDPAELAREARRMGDARRGALVFYQPALTCSSATSPRGRCDAPPSAPTWRRWARSIPDKDLVEAILEPSKAIKKGYETVTIVTDDGRTISGLLAEDRPDAVILRDPGQDGKPITIAKSRIEQQSNRRTVAHAGRVGQRAGLTAAVPRPGALPHGDRRAWSSTGTSAATRPGSRRASVARVRAQSRPCRTDRRPGTQSFQRGEAIYNRVCANCHGTKERPGSLPTAPRFASATLKNGGDPYHMYRTLTDGFGQMAPQTWLVPQQKYDVIHYIREAYLQAGQPAPVRPRRSGLPGPAPQGNEPRARAVGYRALESRWTTGQACRRLLKSAAMVRTSPTRESPSGSTPGRGESLGAEPGWSTITIRCAWRLPGPARASSTGMGSTSTAATRSILGSSARSMSPTPTAPAGQTRTTRASPTSVSGARRPILRSVAARAGHISRDFIATATG